MDHLGNAAEPGCSHIEPSEQRLEGTAIPFVRKLRLEHVEAKFSLFRQVPFGWHELERSVWVDESLNQPGARYAIDPDADAGDPGTSTNAQHCRSRGVAGGRDEPLATIAQNSRDHFATG